jgi:glycine cleavage system regulatory protein
MSKGSFLDRFRSFPEWTHIEASLNSAIKHEVKSAQFYKRAQGTPFREFYRRQPDSVCQTLIEMQTKINFIHDADISQIPGLNALKADLSRMKHLHHAISAKRKDVEILNEQVQKASKVVSSAQSKASSTGLAGDQMQTSAARESLAMATKQHDVYVQMRDAKAAELAVDDVRYKAELSALVLCALKKFAIDRLEKMKPVARLGAEMADLSPRIEYPTDTSMDALRTELQALDAEAASLPD